ncbi:MAG: HAMP domain-containing protein [Bacteroidetes bacterium]|nr:MAG: HAMP domain-containing protein [Bacteroidota bacterium]
MFVNLEKNPKVMKFQFTSIKRKIFTYVMLVSLLPILAVGFYAYLVAESELEEQAFAQLTSIRAAKKRQIENYFQTLDQEMKYLASSQLVKNSIKEFKQTFHDIPPEQSKKNVVNTTVDHFYKNIFWNKLNPIEQKRNDVQTLIPKYPNTLFLQSKYLKNNPEPNLDNTFYDEVHKKYDKEFTEMRGDYGYYDIFLIDEKTGHIVYTVEKEIDYATSLLDGAFRQSNLAKVFAEVQNSDNKDLIALSDFDFYAPSYYAPALFMAAPVYEKGEKIGVFAIQVPIDHINNVMTGEKHWKEDGLGESGETYLVGEDLRMRTDSRFILESPTDFIKLMQDLHVPDMETKLMEHYKTTILLHKCETISAKKALKGMIGTEIVLDYRNIPVLSSYCPLNIRGVRWVLLSEIDEEEVFRPVIALRNKLLMGILAMSFLIFLIVGFVSDSISKPILNLLNGTIEAGKGDFRVKVKATTEDELKTLTISFNTMLENLKIKHEELEQSFAEINQQNEEIAAQRDSIEIQNQSLKVAFTEINQQKEEIEAQRDSIEIQNAELQKTSKEIHEQNLKIQEQRDHLIAMIDKINFQNTEITAQRNEIANKSAQLEMAISQLQRKNKDITASITYAKRIQTAMLPSKEFIGHFLTDFFVFFVPRDIVSGDFYWFQPRDGKLVLAVVDCTGHGVPGALMSMIGDAVLHQVVTEKGILSADLILNELHSRVRMALKQNYSDSKDGMDAVITIIDQSAKKMEYAGAMNPFYYVQNNYFHEIKADKRAVGGKLMLGETARIFTKHTIDISEPTTIYLCSDGYQDQFGGEFDRKFMVRKLRELLFSISDKSMKEQEIILLDTFLNWKGNQNQLDDILIFGVKVS